MTPGGSNDGRRGKVRFKAGDIRDVPDDDHRYEVIDRDLFMTPAPIPQHQDFLMRLAYVVCGRVYPRDLGTVMQAPVGVVLDPETAVQPDLVSIAREHLGIISTRGVDGPPDLVVEVLSPSPQARDRGVKLRRYAAAGIPHDWLLDLRRQAMETYA